MKWILRLTGICLLFLHSAQATNVQPRIIGGAVTSPGEWPYTVALVSTTSSSVLSVSERLFCGGTLVAPTWVLTAAHCFYDLNNFRDTFTHDLQVYAGSRDLGSGGRLLDVQNIIIHASFNPETKDADLALLELSSDAGVVPVSLYEGRPPVDSLSMVLGWGTTQFVSDPDLPFSGTASGISEILREVELPVVADGECEQLFADYSGNMLCAGEARGGKDSCDGDSGGPLLVLQRGRYRQAGIVSFGAGCAVPDLFGVYTRVGNFTNWINGYTEATAGSSGGNNQDSSPVARGENALADTSGNEELAVGVGAFGWFLFVLVAIIRVRGRRV